VCQCNVGPRTAFPLRSLLPDSLPVRFVCDYYIRPVVIVSLVVVYDPLVLLARG